MKGHDAMCPSGHPHLIDRKHCAYCNLIKVVRDSSRTGKSGDGDVKTYEQGFEDGFHAAIVRLQESVTTEP